MGAGTLYMCILSVLWNKMLNFVSMINNVLYRHGITTVVFGLAFIFSFIRVEAQEIKAVEDYEEADTLVEDTTKYIEEKHELPWPQNIRARIDKLMESSIFTTSTVGMEIYDLTADSTIYTYNERQLMRPASTL